MNELLAVNATAILEWKMQKPAAQFVNGGTHYPFIYIAVLVQIYDMDTDNLVHEHETDLADSIIRRTFAEQMSEAYAAGQYSIVEPIRVQRRFK